MVKLTKAQLQARIDELEEQCGLKDQSIAQLQRDADAYQYAQRPSRHVAQPRFADTVRVERRGQCTVKRWMPA